LRQPGQPADVLINKLASLKRRLKILVSERFFLKPGLGTPAARSPLLCLLSASSTQFKRKLRMEIDSPLTKKRFPLFTGFHGLIFAAQVSDHSGWHSGWHSLPGCLWRPEGDNENGIFPNGKHQQ
jgi:hypothetical protein